MELDPSSDNKPQLFVAMKKGQKVLKTAMECGGQRDGQINSDEEYDLNHNLDQYLSTLKSLGSFARKQHHLYKVAGTKRVNVKVFTDQSGCDIADVCFLPDGSILAADRNNEKLKRLDSTTYTVTDYCDLPGHPTALCCVGPQEVAVGLGHSKKVQFVSINNPMILSKSIAVDHWCRGVGYGDGELFVSDEEKSVFVYNLSGTLLRKISQTPSGEAMFIRTRHIAVNGDRIYIVDKKHGLICTDKNWKEMYRYSGTHVKDVWSVCTDRYGGAFICGFDSENVIQVGSDGKEMGVVLTTAEGIKRPKSVCFAQNIQKLIITNNCNDDILLADLV